MSSAFVRSLRGADTPKPAEARKKKSVRWDDREADEQSLGGDGNNSRENSSSSESVLQASAVGANVGTSSANLISSIQEQGIDHLRVPATRPAGAGRAVSTRNHDHHHTSSGSAAAPSSSALGTSARKRVGEQQQRGIQAGAVRVRTPAKPKLVLRQDATPHPSTSTSTTAAAVGRTTPHNYLRRGGITAPTTSPHRLSPTRRTRPGEGAVSQLTLSPTRATPSRLLSRPAVHQEAAVTASVTGTPGGAPRSPARSPVIRSPVRSSPRSARQAQASPRRRLSSAGQALRNVAGGNADDTGSLESMAEEDDVSLLSCSISGGSTASGRPPRSPRASISSRSSGSPPLPGVSPRASRASPRAGLLSGSMSSHRFFPTDSFLEEDGLNEVDDEEEDGDEVM